MSRQFTSRRQTPLNGAALDPEAFAQAYPLDRAAPVNAAAADKEVLGLLLTFVCLALPFHLAMRFLVAFSPALAAGVGGSVALGLLAVALARRHGQDELLRKLPLVLLAVVVAYGLHLLTLVRTEQMVWGGVEWVGMFLLVATVASVVASFFQPAAAAYKTVTQGTSVSSLLTAAAVTALSVVVAVLGQITPWFVQAFVACVAVFGYAALVLFEYAAWVKADPALDLSAQLAQVAAARTEHERGKHTLPARQGRRFLSESLQAGVLFALYMLGGDAFLRPNSELPQLLASFEPEKVHEHREFFLGICFVGGVFFVFEVFAASGTICPTRTLEGMPSLFLGWTPLKVFLTYPDTPHPLLHRLRFRWLRPKAVRLGLTAAVMLLIPLTVSRPSAAPEREVTSPALPLTAPTPPPEEYRPADADLARVLGVSPDAWSRRSQPPAPSLSPAPAPNAGASTPTGSSRAPFLVVLFFAVVAPPAAVYLTVAGLGVFILPTYRVIARAALKASA